MCTGCISDGPAGFWFCRFSVGKWQAPTLAGEVRAWEVKSSQHIVKPTIASGLAHWGWYLSGLATRRSVFSRGSCSADDWNRAVCSLSGHSCPSLTETGFAGQDNFFFFFLLWKFVHFVACLHWTDSVSKARLSFSLSLWSRNRPDRDTRFETEKPEKAKRAWGQSVFGTGSRALNFLSFKGVPSPIPRFF